MATDGPSESKRASGLFFAIYSPMVEIGPIVFLLFKTFGFIFLTIFFLLFWHFIIQFDKW